MNYNNYSYGYGYPQYNNNMMGYGQYSQDVQNNDIIVKYGTQKEAEPFIVPPTKSAIFLNKASGEIYVKSTDNMGNSSFATFKQVFLSDNSTDTQKPVIDPKEFVKRDDLKGFASKEDVESLLAKIKELEGKVVGHE
jgi:hypothetical protein